MKKSYLVLFAFYLTYCKSNIKNIAKLDAIISVKNEKIEGTVWQREVLNLTKDYSVADIPDTIEFYKNGKAIIYGNEDEKKGTYLIENDTIKFVYFDGYVTNGATMKYDSSFQKLEFVLRKNGLYNIFQAQKWAKDKMWYYNDEENTLYFKIR